MSDTSVMASSVRGSGASHRIALTAGSRAGSLTELVSYDALQVLAVARPNAPATGSVSVTVSGTQLGTLDTSVAARLGGTGCEATAWISDSALVARSAQSLRG